MSSIRGISLPSNGSPSRSSSKQEKKFLPLERPIEECHEGKKKPTHNQCQILILIHYVRSQTQQACRFYSEGPGLKFSLGLMAAGFAGKYDSVKKKQKRRRGFFALMDLGECCESRYAGASNELISSF